MSSEPSTAQSLREAILQGNMDLARTLTEQALAEDVDPLALVDEQMVPAMDEMGRRFDCSEAFVPELLLAARAMKGAMEVVGPPLAEAGREPVGRAVVGTVQGDLHDIGKNLVGSMLEGAGFEVRDLGVNVPPEQFVAAVKKEPVHIVGLSALLTTTMMAMKATVQAIREADPGGEVKVMVGGAPITQKFADQIGADGYGVNAVEAVALAREVLAGGR
ncbi:MAG: cobalamin-binding protein [Roseibacillus sp.]|nr:cobalamin-binding protein [Roseibacillus sp.]MCP4730192.1 cobalamin-binding protein [Roseibacillus sp.]MDP7107726.1 corrinoid protein [Roseibacillus sp.]MDP7497535.1 corrinoid protein [Roseibacillus sp.]HJM65065.1 corrinoid protein [Roseibacillus sp.]